MVVSRSPRKAHWGFISLVMLVVSCSHDSTGPIAGPEPVAEVVVSPGSATLLVGATQQLSVSVKDATAQPLAGRPVTWHSSNPTSATVSGAGLVTTLNTGPVTITATSEGKSGSASITINPVPVSSVIVVPSTGALGLGTSSQLAAITRDSAGHPLTGRVISWVSSNPSAVTVSASGLANAAGLGNSTITATSEGKSGTASITVDPIPVASVTVSPVTATVGVAATVPLVATTRDASGQTLPGRVVAWSSSATGVAQVDANGVVTGVTKGGATITATSEGKTGSAAITVIAGVAASVTISPSPVPVSTGDSAQLSALVEDAAGDTLSGQVVTWTSSSPSVATVDGAGLLTGVSVGSAIITATSGGITGSDSALVNLPAVVSVSLSSSIHVRAGSTVQLAATPLDIHGNPLTNRVVNWTSSDSTIATVTAAGVAQGIAAGTVTITATCEGRSATTSLVVDPRPVATTLVSPASVTVGAGLAVQLAAITLDAGGDTLPGRVITWVSSAPAVAAVDSNGLVTGLTAGSASISATSEGATGTAAVTVVLNLAFPALDGGYSHTCSLTANGAAYCWGLNLDGELGSGALSPSSAVPILVTGGVSFASLYPGGTHSCALTAGGSAYCWGSNAYGQLGSGDTTSSAKPIPVAGGLNFSVLSGGFRHVCGLLADGTAYCWGSNTQGELGDGTTTPRFSPVAVSAGLSFVTLSARGAHTCGLTANGAVYCWGRNANGELGDGTHTNRSSPVPVSGGLTFVAITTGANHTCALTAGGVAYCWGDNALAELGDGTTTDRSAPVAVAGGVVFGSVRARGTHTCGLSNGTAYCWGHNNRGQLGDGTTTDRSAPVAVLGGLSFTALSSGANFSCGVTTATLLYCWGDNTSGQLGDGSFTDSSVPVKVLGQP